MYSNEFGLAYVALSVVLCLSVVLSVLTCCAKKNKKPKTVKPQPFDDLDLVKSQRVKQTKPATKVHQVKTKKKNYVTISPKKSKESSIVTPRDTIRDASKKTTKKRGKSSKVNVEPHYLSLYPKMRNAKVDRELETAHLAQETHHHHPVELPAKEESKVATKVVQADKGAGQADKGAEQADKDAGQTDKDAGQTDKDAGKNDKGAGQGDRGAGQVEKGVGQVEKVPSEPKSKWVGDGTEFKPSSNPLVSVVAVKLQPVSGVPTAASPVVVESPFVKHQKKATELASVFVGPNR